MNAGYGGWPQLETVGSIQKLKESCLEEMQLRLFLKAVAMQWEKQQ